MRSHNVGLDLVKFKINFCKDIYAGRILEDFLSGMHGGVNDTLVSTLRHTFYKSD